MSGSWSLNILALELRGRRHRVDLGQIRDTRSLWALIAEAVDADLEDEELAGLVRVLARILPPTELVARPARLDRETLQAIVLAGACKKDDRPKRRAHRERYLVTEAAP